jgi:choline kinase
MGNAQRNIVEVRVTRQLTKKHNYSIIIPAAGEGVRMRTYGPKPLINITPTTNIINNQLNIINACFAKPEIILVCGFESDKVMDNTPEYLIKVENESFNTTNVIRSIGIGLRASTRPKVVIIYGDLVFNSPTLQAPFMNVSSLLIDRSNTMTFNEVGCTIDNFVENVMYDLPNKWAQIGFFTGLELSMLKSICYDRDNNMKYGFEALNEIIDNGGRFVPMSPEGMMVNDIDNSKDIKIGQSIIGG